MKRLLATTAIVTGAMFFQLPAYAAPFSLTDTWSSGTVSHATAGSSSPHLLTTGTLTSNDGFITPVSNPFTQTLTLNIPASIWLFVADPQGSGTNIEDLGVNFTLTDNTGGTANFTAFMDYYAKFSNQQDDMAWFATANASPGQLGSGSLTESITLSDNAVIQISLPFETDWDMAQKMTFTLLDAPSVVATPEPASLTVLGFGLLGMIAIKRKRSADTHR